MKISQQHFAFLLAALSAIGPFAIDTYLPAFPEMAQQLGASALHIQQTLTFYLVPFGFMMLWHGTLVGRLGQAPHYSRRAIAVRSGFTAVRFC
jgi:DHA1 family bicyclomycin/chloramphenicol resistance-like MFS transporter